MRSKGDGHSVRTRKILVPVDISDASVSALPEALSLAGRIGTEVLAVYVFWLNGSVYDIPPGLVEELIKSSEARLAQRVEDETSASIESHAKGADIQIKCEVLHGISPAASLKGLCARELG